MALDKLVDSAQLDSDLGDVADAIRAKSGGSGQLAFPLGFISEIGSIQTGGGGGSAWELVADVTTDADANTIQVDIPVAKQGMQAYIVVLDVSASENAYLCPRLNAAATGTPYLPKATRHQYSLCIVHESFAGRDFYALPYSFSNSNLKLDGVNTGDGNTFTSFYVCGYYGTENYLAGANVKIYGIGGLPS